MAKEEPEVTQCCDSIPDKTIKNVVLCHLLKLQMKPIEFGEKAINY